MAERQSVNALVERMAAWVEQQPEYPLLFLSGRDKRKRAANIIAKRLMILPSSPPNTRPTREEQRAAEQRVKQFIGRESVKVSAKAARQRMKAERDRKRYARLSAERLADVMDAAFDPEGEDT